MNGPRYQDIGSKEESERLLREIQDARFQKDNQIGRKKSFKGVVVLFLIIIAWHLTGHLPTKSRDHPTGKVIEDVDFEQASHLPYHYDTI